MERKNPTTAKKRSKVVISEAIPLSLSKRVLPAALLKNLVLIVRYTDFVCEKESSPIAVALVMNCDLMPKYKQAISKDTK